MASVPGAGAAGASLLTLVLSVLATWHSRGTDKPHTCLFYLDGLTAYLLPACFTLMASLLTCAAVVGVVHSLCIVVAVLKASHLPDAPR